MNLKAKLNEELGATEREFVEGIVQVPNLVSTNKLNLNMLIDKERSLLMNPKLFVFVWAMLSLFEFNVNARKNLYVFLDKFLY